MQLNVLNDLAEAMKALDGKKELASIPQFEVEPHSCKKSCAGQLALAFFTSVVDDRSERVARDNLNSHFHLIFLTIQSRGCAGQLQRALLPFTIEPHFRAKGLRGTT